MTVRLFRDPAADGGGGTPPDLTNPIEGLNPDGTLQDGYQLDELGRPAKIPDSPPGEPNNEPVEGLDAEGNLLEGYEQLEDGTIQLIDDGDPADDTDPAQFYAAVEAITGESYQVDYGDVDPITPEGVAIRDRVVRQQGALEMETHLKTAYPKGYAYFLHLQSGGTDAEFFAKATPTLPAKVEFEADTDAQARMLLNDLTGKGVDPDIAQASVDKAIKENTLKAKALALYDVVEQAQQKQVQELNDFNQRQQNEFNTAVNTLLSTYDKVIKTEMNLVVPESKQPEFKKFLQDHTRWDNGKFYIAQEIGQDMPKLIEQMYYAFIKGDLKSLVERKARTLTTQRLRINAEKDKAAQQKSPSAPDSKPKFVPLSDIKF